MSLTIIAQRYQVLGLQGQGGMGSVYKAHDLQLNRTVALKCLMSQNSEDPMALTLKEAQTLAQLNHPHVLKVYDIFKETSESTEASSKNSGNLWIVSEWIDGNTFQQLLPPLPFAIVVALLVQALEALAYVHKQKIFHRDLKPQNLMIHKDGNVVIIDFGVAAVTGSSGKTIAGSLRYIDPKVLAGQTADHMSDLYALGLIAVELMSGQAAVPEMPLFELYRFLEKQLPQRIDQQLDGCFPPLSLLLKKMIFSRNGQAFLSTQDCLDEATGLYYKWFQQNPSQVIHSFLESNAFDDKAVIQACLNEAKTVQDSGASDLRSKSMWLAFLSRYGEQDEIQSQQRNSQLSMSSQPNSDESVGELATSQPQSQRWLKTPMIKILFLGLCLGLGFGLYLFFQNQSQPINSSTSTTTIEASPLKASIESPIKDPIKDSVADEQFSEKTTVTHETAISIDQKPAESAPVKQQAPPAVKKAAQINACRVKIAASAWADVMIDGAPQGRLPRATPFMLKPGKHALKLSSPFVETIETTIIVPQSAEHSYYFELQQKP